MPLNVQSGGLICTYRTYDPNRSRSVNMNNLEFLNMSKHNLLYLLLFIVLMLVNLVSV